MDGEIPPNTMIGKISVKSEHDVEWKIDNIFSFTRKNQRYDSPLFTLSNCKWFFTTDITGEKGIAGHISLYLMLSNYSSDQGAIFQCGVKKRNGTIDKGNTCNWIFNENGGFGYETFLEISHLVGNKTELAPSDTLTITCTLWMFDDFDSTINTDSLSQNFLGMFTSQTACDVILQVREEKFFAHKFVLMARSPVFTAMFQTPMKEKIMGVVDIQDCDPGAFRNFLVYLYSGRLEKLSRYMFELCQIAHKYVVEDLRMQCLVAIMGNLSVENIADAAILADKFDEKSVKIKCQRFFNENYDKIFRTSNWKTFLDQEPLLANEMLIAMSDDLKKRIII